MTSKKSFYCCDLRLYRQRIPVPDLTRSAGIQLNKRVSLRHRRAALTCAPDISSIRTTAKPSGDRITLGGFVGCGLKAVTDYMARSNRSRTGHTLFFGTAISRPPPGPHGASSTHRAGEIVVSDYLIENDAERE
jgi:hypothetical protein